MFSDDRPKHCDGTKDFLRRFSFDLVACPFFFRHTNGYLFKINIVSQRGTYVSLDFIIISKYIMAVLLNLK